LYSLSVINSFVEFSGGSVYYTDSKRIKLQGNGKKVWKMIQRRLETEETGDKGEWKREKRKKII
jgi:hypothetical protein